jgi:hypothetical protein
MGIQKVPIMSRDVYIADAILIDIYVFMKQNIISTVLHYRGNCFFNKVFRSFF